MVTKLNSEIKMSLIPPTASLVKYDNPQLVSTNTDKRSKVWDSLEDSLFARLATSTVDGWNLWSVLVFAQVRTPKAGQQPTVAVMGSGGPVPSPPKAKISSGDAQKTEEILNSILPPKEWSEGGQLWVQSVSSTPATRLDVINLQEQLDTRLQQRQARETGICPVRRELYSQCFGESLDCYSYLMLRPNYRWDDSPDHHWMCRERSTLTKVSQQSVLLSCLRVSVTVFMCAGFEMRSEWR